MKKIMDILASRHPRSHGRGNRAADLQMVIRLTINEARSGSQDLARVPFTARKICPTLTGIDLQAAPISITILLEAYLRGKVRGLQASLQYPTCQLLTNTTHT